ncbi:leucyl aminopeptidase family protein [Fibrella forsythiae]|uniref:Leucyl aminopeptidase family protein n=1 Tax=Fibrella forsythiae TaxID=2817061 RepID=A0ABS3JFH2_9BACT|nr:leucyl aminopeptidase family protein [Fibrella forsythiae]MBO0948738.1 leucyl aminopeptidase family protein [Fibrella forsythiae]
MQIHLHTTAPTTTATIWPLLKEQPLPEQVQAAQGDFKGDLNETQLVYSADGQKHWLLGLGEKPSSHDYLRAIRKLTYTQKSKFPAAVSLNLTGLPVDAIEAIVLGTLGGGYNLKLYHTTTPEVSPFYSQLGQLNLTVAAADREAAQQAIDRATIIWEAQKAMLDLMNAPSNYKTPQVLADWAVASGRTYGYSVTVMDHDELARLGYNALLSVGQGSENPPMMLVLDYNPANATGSTVGLVGKGVTFDTGGISIKQSTNMHLMKSDMGGAAAVLGTLEVAARLKLPRRVVGVVPTTENVVDGMATKPGDVITSYLGKTIEIIDTDAEGRVILADGLGHMIRHIQPDVLIDLATLTGNVIAALGYQAGGLFTQNDELSAQLQASGDRTGERLWRLPLWDVYKDDLTSDVADVKNYSGKPINGAIAAAKFLEVFTEKHPAWAHLDIAGMAFADTEFGQQKNATAFGIRLLIDFLTR